MLLRLSIVNEEYRVSLKELVTVTRCNVDNM